MEEKLISEFFRYFNLLDIVAVLAVYYIVQQLKAGLPKQYRPYLVFVVGFGVAVAFGASFGGMKMVLFFGIVYSASAIMLRKTGIMDRLANLVKNKLGTEE